MLLSKHLSTASQQLFTHYQSHISFCYRHKTCLDMSRAAFFIPPFTHSFYYSTSTKTPCMQTFWGYCPLSHYSWCSVQQQWPTGEATSHQSDPAPIINSAWEVWHMAPARPCSLVPAHNNRLQLSRGISHHCLAIHLSVWKSSLFMGLDRLHLCTCEPGGFSQAI